jgi:ABC-2 type transport system ATP-binding protein
VIKVKKLKKFFGMIPAINDVSFEIKKGEIVGFLGPNGAGKTTTMRILSCFFPPTSGHAFVSGYDVVKDSLKVRSKVGYFIEKAPLYTDMTVSGFLNFVAEARRLDKIVKKKTNWESNGRMRNLQCCVKTYQKPVKRLPAKSMYGPGHPS